MANGQMVGDRSYQKNKVIINIEQEDIILFNYITLQKKWIEL